MNMPVTPEGSVHSQALADWGHPEILDKVKSFSIGCYTPREYFHSLHEFVRDEIFYGFNVNGHMTKASEVLAEGIGFSTTKTTLLLAMCKAAGIPARVRFGRAHSALLRGFADWLPPTLPHCHLEVQLEGMWRQVDSYIVDRPLTVAALRKLKAENHSMGYGLALENAPFSMETCLDGQGFLQKGGVIEELGVFDDPVQFFQSSLCKSHDRLDGGIIGRLYRGRLPEVNMRIEGMRMKDADILFWN